MQAMKRLSETSGPMAWLKARPAEEALTGFDATGWPASTWILHAMYENSDLAGLGTYDDLHRQRLQSGDVAPLIVGDVNLDAFTKVTGTPLGYPVRPGRPWVRVTWAEYLDRFPGFTPCRDVPPCHRWFPPGSWPVAIEPPPEGSLDGESVEALLSVLTAHSTDGPDTDCLAFYGSLPAGDFDGVHLWTGPLKNLRDLIEDQGGPYGYSPTNFWPVEREWFVWTDYDLDATKVSGDQSLVRALRAEPRLECLDWPGPDVT
ncbi:hypothetical protein [Actinoplanes sp. NPDC049681]|uniref:hypothetical protein n=1 Tax=Actinoplanes sp. NPDC049681 TaxID=3363905 RepID=UPI0037BB41BC